MKKRFSRKALVSCVLAVGLVVVVARTALALSNICLRLGTVASYDFAGYGPGHPVPGTIQIHAFKMSPGDAVPWHYHKGVSYVIVARGTLTERHLVAPNQCESEEATAGSAFVEPAGLVHTVTNTGNDAAIIWWATVFPESDGVVRFSPEFTAGGVYPVDPPNCS